MPGRRQAAERSRKENDPLIQHRLFPDDPEPVAWRSIASVADLVDGKGRLVHSDDQAIALFLDNGTVCAIDARCPHAGAPLDRGWLEQGVVTCPLHRWKFEIRTGRCLTDPSGSVRSYRTRVDDSGTIWVESEKRADHPGRHDGISREPDENR